MSRVISSRIDLPKAWTRRRVVGLKTTTQTQPLLFLASATITGILIDWAWGAFSSADSSATRIWLWSGWIALCTIVVFHYGRHRRGVAAIAAVLALSGLGGLDHAIQSRSYDEALILSMITEDRAAAIVEGVIDRPTVLRPHPMANRQSRRDVSPWQMNVQISLRKIRDGQEWIDVDGRLLINVDGRCDEWLPGDRVRVFGNLRGVGLPSNPGEKSMAGFYRRERLHGRMEVNRVEQIVNRQGAESGYFFSRLMARISAKSRDGLLHHLGESTGPLAVAIVIGQRDFVDTTTRDQLLVTGTAHLLSVSGMHLAIVVMMTTWMAMLFQIPINVKACIVLAVCLFYCAITGSRPPVLRAAVLVLTLMFAIWMRRPGQAINTLSLAALILVLWNPENVFSVGVQLSFLAVATLVLTSGRGQTGSPETDGAAGREEQLAALVESSRPVMLTRLRKGFSMVGQLFWFSFCVSVTSLPLVWHQFNVVSWISIPINVVLGPFLFVSLATGIATAACVMIYAPMAVVPATACHGCLTTMRWIIEWAAALPMGHAWLPAPPTWWVIVFYTVLFASLGGKGDRWSHRFRFGWVASWIVIAFMMATHSPPMESGSIEATFVDVGHGTSVVMRLGDGEVWLYDCGRLGNDVGSSRYIDQAIWYIGVTRLDRVLLSHADADHFNALPGLLARFRVRQMDTPPGMLAEPETALDPVRKAIARYKIPIRELSRGDTVRLAHSTIRVLHPPMQRLDASDNANSLVMVWEGNGQSLLLPGDLEPPGTGVLMSERRPRPGGVLMAPHHGSLRMDAAMVLQWYRPSETVVSGGERAGRPEVSAMLGTHGSRVHVTAQDGAIRVRIDPKGNIEVRSWLHDPW